mmetsp:Transcript_36519/g.44198  ORF Transcript_36519/g.44198 Transcript_36519/m.44198 type:complete len:132 (+) Transcript_36519:222-617(+)|eukprot:CAMPEP_0197862636 /NCGR_PEP_ID=MMETSP1438-20131217/39567_1 /TAXON_ID=1461541 /ORGANISM="Pterosperma sp., Strain CCMP1384" /LENGTH=131 /DNA_ID=CAMNT_0043480271 /DNA_START=222 /DNA_END=617 /DNA_ORIENTATION=+
MADDAPKKGVVQGVTPYLEDESWRERIYKEEEKSYEFWGPRPQQAKALGMQHSLRKPKKPVPLHAHAPKDLPEDAVSFITTGSTKASETTQVLNDRLDRLEAMLAQEKSLREQVEKEVLEVSKIRTVNDIW